MARTGSKEKPTTDKPCPTAELVTLELQIALTAGLDDEMKSIRKEVLRILMGDLKPVGPLESMLASHVIATHEAILSSMRAAMHPKQSYEREDMLLRQADKLMRLFNAQLAMLMKLRGGTNQNITVKYLHIGEGGQAIVGNVNGGRGRAGRKASGPAALERPRGTPKLLPEPAVDLEPVMRIVSVEDADAEPTPKRRVRR